MSGRMCVGPRISKAAFQEAGFTPGTHGIRQFLGPDPYADLRKSKHVFEFIGALIYVFATFGSWLWLNHTVTFGFLIVVVVLVAVAVLMHVMIWLGIGWGALVGICTVTALAAQGYWAGMLENRSNIIEVRMQVVKLTIPPEDEAPLRALQLKVLKLLHGPRVDNIVTRTKTLAARMGKGYRANPVRAVPVILDISSSQDRFWALENDGVLRYQELGYPEVRVRLVDQASINPKVSEDLARWQSLRQQVAIGGCADVAKRLREIDLKFAYASLDDDGKWGRLSVLFLCSASQQRNLRASHTKVVSIDELEERFHSLLEKARLRVEAAKDLRESRRKQATAQAPQLGPLKDTATVCEAPEEEDAEESLCIVCLELRAEMVMRNCGHLAFCTRCRRRMVLIKKGLHSAKCLSQPQSESARIPCPICRQVSTTIRKGSFKGRIFPQ